MRRIVQYLIPTLLLIMAFARPSLAVTYTAATVVVTGAETQLSNGQWDSGTYTVSFGSYTESVSYGQFSTASSIASAIAAKYSTDPLSEASPKLCAQGICAKSNGPTIVFQIAYPAMLSPISVTPSTTTSFGANISGWPTIASGVILSSTASSAIIGTPLTFNASITPSANSGYITFLDGASVLGIATVVNGGSLLTTSSLVAGTHSITALYSGSSTALSGLSQVLPEMVQYSSTVLLGTSQNPSQYGKAVVLSASMISPNAGNGSPTPTGSVTFFDGPTNLGSIALNPAGTASQSTSTLPLGTSSVTAMYSGDQNYARGTSTALAETVNAASTTISVVPSPTSAIPGNPVTIVATISSGPTGSVAFLDGSTIIGTASIVGNTATFTTSRLELGDHTLTATWGGNASYLASVSTGIIVTIANDPVSITLSCIPSTVPASQSTTCTSQVPAGSSGEVSFYVNGQLRSIVIPTAAGTNSLAVTMENASTSPQNSTVSATYAGDSTYGAATVETSVTVTPNGALLACPVFP